MIINEQHDLDKAKENVDIVQKGLRFFLRRPNKVFHHH